MSREINNMQTESEGFLSRWSRRKQQTNEQIKAEVITDVELQLDSEQGLQKENQQAEILADTEVEVPVLTDADMPPLESLNEDSDYSGFMSSGVSDELRNLALKKLFKAATFNVCDGLDEYDEDYTSFEKLGDIITCDMKHQIEVEARKKLEKEAELKAAEQDKELSEAGLSDASEVNDEAASEENETDPLIAKSDDSDVKHQGSDDLSAKSSSFINETGIESYKESDIESDIESEIESEI